MACSLLEILLLFIWVITVCYDASCAYEKEKTHQRKTQKMIERISKLEKDWEFKKETLENVEVEISNFTKTLKRIENDVLEISKLALKNTPHQKGLQKIYEELLRDAKGLINLNKYK